MGKESQKITAIYVVGPSSTGKTTLCQAIASRMDIKPPAYISEVARTIMREKGFSKLDVNRIEMQECIMKEQLRADIVAREAVARGDFPMLLSDRSAIDPIVYAHMSSEEDARRLIETPEFQNALPDYKKSTFVFLQPVSAWIQDDGVRSLDNMAICTMTFRNVLARVGLEFMELGENCQSLQERLRRVLGYAEQQS